MTPNAARYDVLVIGAGIAGTAIAKGFARQGRRVLVIERNLSEPDRIVGELLQPGGVEALSQLGMSDCLEGIDSIPVKGYHMYWKDLETTFWFCPGKGETRRGGPDSNPEGRSFHHGRFVMKLREAIREDPQIDLLEATVLEILRDGATGTVIGVDCIQKGSIDHEQHFAHLTILADGLHSKFRSQFTRRQPECQSRFWGLEMKDVTLPRPGYAHGVLGKGPPMLLYQTGQQETRILIDIPDEVYERLGGYQEVKAYIQERVLSAVPVEVQPALAKAVHEGRLRSMPNQWMSSTRNVHSGLIMLGDASNMRHPVTGAGMTVALKDAVLLSTMLEPDNVPSLQDSPAVLRVLGSFHWRRKRYCAALNILAQALYLLFVSEDEGLEIMQRGFIRFIQRGEQKFAIPVGLMGGLIENPFLLFYYFFGIALYSMGLHLQQATILGLPMALFRSVAVFASAVRIILPAILDELRA